jgi:pimeloyl-ACP methyl ester carboxylesterase
MSVDASERWCPAPDAGDDDGWISVHGHRLRVSVRAGTGTPLLLVNGFGARLGVWDDLRSGLEMPTVAFDLPGTGGSRPTVVPYPLPVTVRMVAALLDRLDYRTVDVLGVSLGGGIAQQLAFLAPQRVRRLVLASTNFGLGSLPGRPAAWLNLLAPRGLSLRQMARSGSRTYGGRTRHDPAWLRAFAESAFTSSLDFRGHLWQVASALTWWSLPILPFLRQPTLVLAGDDDPLVPVLNSRALAALIPEARAQIIKGAGHLFVFEQPATAAALINDFLHSPR